MFVAISPDICLCTGTVFIMNIYQAALGQLSYRIHPLIKEYLPWCKTTSVCGIMIYLTNALELCQTHEKVAKGVEY